MLSEPKIVERDPQPYAAIVLTLKQPEIGQVAPPLVDTLIAWVEAKGGTVTGRSFFNYPQCYADGRMDVMVGVPTDSVMDGDERVVTGTLPGGRYASLTANVAYDQLNHANMQLGDWAHGQGLELDGRRGNGFWMEAVRLEIYHLDPHEHPSGLPLTEVAFRLMR